MGKKLKIIAITLIIIIIFASFFTFVNKDLNRHKESNFSINSFEDCREIVLLKATPNSIIRTFETVFLEYTIRLVEERTLAYFLSKGRITMAYDVQALPLIKSSKDKFYFYPIYCSGVLSRLHYQKCFYRYLRFVRWCWYTVLYILFYSFCFSDSGSG